MEESFYCQGRTWTRRALPGEPVTVSGGTWRGDHVLSDGKTEMTVWQSTVAPSEKGTSLAYVPAMPLVLPELVYALNEMGWKVQ